MKFIKTVTGLHSQPLNNLNLQPGSWVRTGDAGCVDGKGVLMGSIMNKPVIVYDQGQSRDVFRQQMKESRNFVKSVNDFLNES